MSVNLPELALAREAAEWLDRLGHDEDARENEAFTRWITASPLHVEAFLKASAVEEMLHGIDPQRRIDIGPLLASAARGVVPLPGPRARDAHAGARVEGLRAVAREFERRRGAPRWRIAATLALLVILVAWAGWWIAPSMTESETYATQVGEQRSIELADGSILRLNARSRAKASFTDSAREIVLDGEALFTVKGDPRRPFRVLSANTVIQAIGTQFNVYQRPSGTVVTVIDGVVQVSTMSPDAPGTNHQLTAGEEARVYLNGRIDLTEQPRATAATLPTWNVQRLVFSEDRLEDIAAEFNRWNRTQIIVSDKTLASRLYSATFDAHEPAALIAFLETDSTLVVERDGDRVFVRPK